MDLWKNLTNMKNVQQDRLQRDNNRSLIWAEIVQQTSKVMHHNLLKFTLIRQKELISSFSIAILWFLWLYAWKIQTTNESWFWERKISCNIIQDSLFWIHFFSQNAHMLIYNLVYHNLLYHLSTTDYVMLVTNNNVAYSCKGHIKNIQYVP